MPKPAGDLVKRISMLRFGLMVTGMGCLKGDQVTNLEIAVKHGIIIDIISLDVP